MTTTINSWRDRDLQIREARRQSFAAAENAAGNGPVSVWKRKLEALCASGISRPLAVERLVQTNPELHEEYVRALNGGREIRERLR